MLIFFTSLSGLVYQFSIQDRYQAGQAIVLSRGEARALNLMRADNVTRNKSRLVKKHEPEDGIISDQDLQVIQQELDAYDGRYQFSENGQDNQRMGDIEREAIEASKVLGLPPENQACREMARKRLLAKRGIARRALAGL